VYPLNTVLVGAYPLNTVLVGEYLLNTVLVGAYPLYTVNTPYSMNTYLEGPARNHIIPKKCWKNLVYQIIFD
jgi:hypothetical protein